MASKRRPRWVAGALGGLAALAAYDLAPTKNTPCYATTPW